jgi:hypothetical protein
MAYQAGEKKKVTQHDIISKLGIPATEVEKIMIEGRTEETISAHGGSLLLTEGGRSRLADLLKQY